VLCYKDKKYSTVIVKRSVDKMWHRCASNQPLVLIGRDFLLPYSAINSVFYMIDLRC